jgi:extracellular factor (EF) 3-hydroxypalmitic acid methyl ester biosynthesis protein
MTDFLEKARLEFENGDSLRGMHRIIHGLYAVRRKLETEEWRNYVFLVREHPVVVEARHCPFTLHASSKPAGYPGDAGLIDHIYGYRESMQGERGDDIYAYTIASPACRAVRFRRFVLAGAIDRCLHERGKSARIFSLAAGHLRELHLSRAIERIKPALFLALDQDSLSLQVINDEFGKYGVTTKASNIREIIAGRSNYTDMDLVYTAGLYDYLSDDVAKKLTTKLFNSVASGGMLLTANFLPNIADVGYMEAVMDWWLTYREETQMLSLAIDIPKDSIEKVRQYRDPDENITFLEIWKK